MTKSKGLFRFLIVLLVLAPMVHLYHFALEYPLFGAWTEEHCAVLTEFTMETNGETSPITLPTVLHDGAPDETVILTTQITNMALEKLYVKSVYAPLKFYANDVLLYEFSAEGTYPSYLPSPIKKTCSFYIAFSSYWVYSSCVSAYLLPYLSDKACP